MPKFNVTLGYKNKKPFTEEMKSELEKKGFETNFSMPDGEVLISIGTLVETDNHSQEEATDAAKKEIDGVIKKDKLPLEYRQVVGINDIDGHKGE